MSFYNSKPTLKTRTDRDQARASSETQSRKTRDYNRGTWPQVLNYQQAWIAQFITQLR